MEVTPIPTKDQIRQTLENRHGKELQKKFAEASVAVCGLGGLGSHIATALARAGVGRLHLIDFDRVDLTNLHRQQYFIHQLGMPKTQALEQTLLQINPYLTIQTDAVRVTEKNVQELLVQDDLICEAFDVAEAKAMLVNAVLEYFPEKYLVAASGMAGMDSANIIRTRRVVGRFYLCGDETADVADGMGLVASRVMVCAAHQAHMILRLLAGEREA